MSLPVQLAAADGSLSWRLTGHSPASSHRCGRPPRATLSNFHHPRYSKADRRQTIVGALRMQPSLLWPCLLSFACSSVEVVHFSGFGRKTYILVIYHRPCGFLSLKCVCVELYSHSQLRSYSNLVFNLSDVICVQGNAVFIMEVSLPL